MIEVNRQLRWISGIFLAWNRRNFDIGNEAYGTIESQKRAKSMILRTVKHGKKRAIVLRDEILASAGIDETDSIELTVTPKGAILLKAAEPQEESPALHAFKKIKHKYSRLFRNLADR